MPSELLQRAFDKLSELPEYEQDEIAGRIISLFESDARRWDAAFARSIETLDKLAAEAISEYRAGRTEPLDPDKL